MDTQPPPAGDSGSNTCRLVGATTIKKIIGTHQERRHMLVQRETANAATQHLTQGAYFNIVCKTGRSKHKKRHAVGSEYIHIEPNGSQLTV
jgi:hypothetical protein